MGLFEANYAGHCASCRKPIQVGDRVGFTSGYDRVVCSSCIGSSQTAHDEPKGDPCPECWLVHKGECM